MATNYGTGGLSDLEAELDADLDRPAELPAYAIRARREAERLAAMPRHNNHITYTVVEVHAGRPSPCVAPNGSSRGVDYYTSVTVRQDWANVPENGIYAGLSYRQNWRYHSSFADGIATQRVGSSSQPWKD